MTYWSEDFVRPCGTEAAYRRHLRHGEAACLSCLAAHARYKQDHYDPVKRRQRYLEHEGGTGLGRWPLGRP